MPSTDVNFVGVGVVRGGVRPPMCSVTLEPDASYMVVPFTAIPEQEGPFVLRTFSSAPVEVERPPPAHEVQVRGFAFQTAHSQRTSLARRLRYGLLVILLCKIARRRIQPARWCVKVWGRSHRHN